MCAVAWGNRRVVREGLRRGDAPGGCAGGIAPGGCAGQGNREAGKLPLYCIGEGQASCPTSPVGWLDGIDQAIEFRGVSLPHTHLYRREAACLPLLPFLASPSFSCLSFLFLPLLPFLASPSFPCLARLILLEQVPWRLPPGSRRARGPAAPCTQSRFKRISYQQAISQVFSQAQPVYTPRHRCV